MIAKSHFLNIIFKNKLQLTTLLPHHHHQNFLLPLPRHQHLLRPAALLKSHLNHACTQCRRDKQFLATFADSMVSFSSYSHVAFIFIIVKHVLQLTNVRKTIQCMHIEYKQLNAVKVGFVVCKGVS